MIKKKMFLCMILSIFVLNNVSYASGTTQNTEFKKNNPNNILEYQDSYYAKDNTARKSIPVISNNSGTKITKNKTKQAYTSGTIVENIGEDGKEFDKNIPPKRQFLTFATNDGKEFHLIIDYLKDTEQVRMLTEISQSDLLNMIDIRLRDSSGNAESPEAMEKRIRNEVEQEYKEKYKKEAEAREEQEKMEAQAKSKKNNGGSKIFLILVCVIVFIIAYFMKFKNKKDTEIDDKHDPIDEEMEEFDYDGDDDIEDTENEHDEDEEDK